MRNALNKVNAVQPKVNQAIALLQPKENNSALVHAKNQLQNAVNESDPTRGMTSTTANNYNTKKREAQAEIQKLIKSLQTEMQLLNKFLMKNKVEQALQALNNAKSDLRADKSQLQNAYNKLTEQVSTNGKTPSSIKNMKQRVKRLKLNIMRLK